MNYSQFLFSQLLVAMVDTKYPINYDILYDVSKIMYRDYDESNHNVSDKNEYDCMVDYIQCNIEWNACIFVNKLVIAIFFVCFGNTTFKFRHT